MFFLESTSKVLLDDATEPLISALKLRKFGKPSAGTTFFSTSAAGFLIDCFLYTEPVLTAEPR